MSGLEKSSSLRPEARNMARAPALFAPWIKVLLRSFGLSSLTYASPDTGSTRKESPNHSLQEIRTQKIWAIILIWMMARVSRNFAGKPPSPALAVDFDDLANSYNSGYDANLHSHGAREVLRRHGVASHFFLLCEHGPLRAAPLPPCKVTAWGRRVNQSN